MCPAIIERTGPSPLTSLHVGPGETWQILKAQPDGTSLPLQVIQGTEDGFIPIEDLQTPPDRQLLVTNYTFTITPI